MALKLSQSTAVGGRYSIVERRSWESMLPWALVMAFSEEENEKGAHSSGTWQIQLEGSSPKVAQTFASVEEL